MKKNEFQIFKNGVGGDLCRRMLGVNLAGIRSWDALSALVQDSESIIDNLQRVYPALSSGEKPILEALLWACDYAHVADQLSGGATYRHINNMDEEHKETYLAILRQE